jgi:hypothetical protein
MMMAMGCFSAEVIESGVNPSGLGCWCWFNVGSGNKKTRIVMAYQPSGSKSTNSAGMTARSNMSNTLRLEAIYDWPAQSSLSN